MSGAINTDLFRGNIVTSRVRLARNFADFPFKIKDANDAKEIAKQVSRTLVKTDDFSLLFMSDLSDIKKEAMKERHLISNNLIKNFDCGAVLVNADESVSIMINEEDVIREQCFLRGLRLKDAYDKLAVIDGVLFDNFDVAYDDNFGYLTACPTNVGTGLRASAMLFLPALTESGKLKSAMKGFARKGLTVRGAYGEGSSAEGCFYQISNEITLGLSEEEILSLVEDTIICVCEAEREESEKIFAKHELKTMDMAKKSFGILTNAVLLSYGEFLTEIARVKLGATMGYIDIQDVEKLDDLIMSVRPANLCEKFGRMLTSTERDLYRAETVSKTLIKLKG